MAPLAAAPVNPIEHHVDDEALDVDKRSASSTGDVRELLAGDELPRTVERRHEQHRRVEVEALRQRRRRDDHLQHTLR